MNILLILRSEILDIIILLLLIIYGIYGAKFQVGRQTFLRTACMALGHAVFALVTEITVNSNTVPKIVNDVCHVIFFMFSLLFSLEYFRYALSLVFPANKMRPYLIVGIGLSAAAMVVMLLSKIEYLQGVGTKYSAGRGPTLCYMLGFILLTFADVLLIIHRRHIENNYTYTLLPISLVGLALMGIQIVVPEFLFTGSSITMMALGVFLSLENPYKHLSTRAFIDSDTNAYNRNRYDEDIKDIQVQLGGGTLSETITYAIVDLNCLKSVNDTYGHLEGDKLLCATARILMNTLKHSVRVYRIGGDEFAALYRNVDVNVIETEIAEAKRLAGEYRDDNGVSLSFSAGYAKLAGDINEMVRNADLMMYADKRDFYQKSGIERRSTLSID